MKSYFPIVLWALLIAVLGIAAYIPVSNIYDSITNEYAKIDRVGNHAFGVEGVNFQNGLTYTTSGTMTNASVTLFWE